MDKMDTEIWPCTSVSCTEQSCYDADGVLGEGG